ncbi:MAG: hypothetical protein Q3966_02700 [Neisseria sp.]|nr:hypothetical protein [Neisseria sp.]
MNKTLLIALGLLAATLPAATAAPLDSSDQGQYVLLDKEEMPTPMQMQFILKGKQWIMNGREGEGAWKPVCQGTGECKLVVSSSADVARWKKTLPANWQPHNFGCINNKAFAFCRVDHATDPNRKGYWWFGLVDGNIIPLAVNRL